MEDDLTTRWPILVGVMKDLIMLLGCHLLMPMVIRDGIQVKLLVLVDYRMVRGHYIIVMEGFVEGGGAMVWRVRLSSNSNNSRRAEVGYLHLEQLQHHRLR